MREEIRQLLKTIDMSDIEKERLIDLFEMSWKIYYTKHKDIKFDVQQMRDLWFYIKINLLSKECTWKNEKAIDKLRHELNVNAKKFENPDYKVQFAYKWLEV